MSCAQPTLAHLDKTIAIGQGIHQDLAFQSISAGFDLTSDVRPLHIYQSGEWGNSVSPSTAWS